MPSEHLVEKIVVAVNLSPHSEATAAAAFQIAERLGARLTLVHVYSPETVNEFITEKDYDAFAKQRWLAGLDQHGAQTLRSGVPGR